MCVLLPCVILYKGFARSIAWQTLSLYCDVGLMCRDAQSFVI